MRGDLMLVEVSRRIDIDWTLNTELFTSHTSHTVSDAKFVLLIAININEQEVRVLYGDQS